MKKMTPMILVILMLVSVLSSIDVYELQEMNEYEETSGRASPDPEVVTITSPRETTTMPNGNQLNELLVGEVVNFNAYFRNSGDADLTSLGYTATIYDDASGIRGDVATDENGDQLSWSNTQVICAQGCQYTTLAAGEYLNGGETTMGDNSGNSFEWVAVEGDYWVSVTVETGQINDIGNDEYVVQISVRDYYDIVLDVTWVDDQGVPIDGGVEGTDDFDFQISLNLVSPGDMLMNIRNATVSITVDGDLSNNAPSTAMIGQSANVEVESTDVMGSGVNDTRLIFGSDGNPGSTTSITGLSSVYTVTPPSDGTFSVEVQLLDYYVYEACSSSSGNCEVQKSTGDDEYNGNNLDEITGSSSTVHDIALLDFKLYALDENGMFTQSSESFGNMGYDLTTTLTPGTYLLYASAYHASTNPNNQYEWNMSFNIYDYEGNPTNDVLQANSCSEIFSYQHEFLGTSTDKVDAEMEGEACLQFDFGEGTFFVEAELLMEGGLDGQTTQVDDKITDMVPSNNVYQYNIDFENFAPQIISLEAITKDLTIVGTSSGDVLFNVDTFDVENDPMTIVWGNSLSGEDYDQCENMTTCTVPTTTSDVPALTVYVEITDDLGKSDIAETSVSVWNKADMPSTSLDNSLTAEYSVIYTGTGMGTAFDNGTLETLTLPGCLGTYSAVGAVVVTPDAVFEAKDVHNHTLSVTFPTSLGVTGAWLGVGNTYMEIGSGAADDVGVANTGGYAYEFAAGSDTLTPGSTIYLISDDCAVATGPTGTVSGVTASAAANGAIKMGWSAANLLSDEAVFIDVCESSAGCATPVQTFSYSDGTSVASLSGSNTVHGTEYYVSAQVCNANSCTQAVTASAVADSQVAAVTASAVTISESGETWIVDWDASSVDSDIASWMVCYEKGNGFTTDQMSDLIGTNSCVDAADTTSTIDKPTIQGTYTYHFAIVPVDVVGNTATSASTDSVLYNRTADNTNPDDGSTTTESDSSSGVPTWTWGVIGIVVVAAFVAGAFILSRGEGGEGGDDDKEWDY